MPNQRLLPFRREQQSSLKNASSPILPHPAQYMEYFFNINLSFPFAIRLPTIHSPSTKTFFFLCCKHRSFDKPYGRSLLSICHFLLPLDQPVKPPSQFLIPKNSDHHSFFKRNNLLCTEELSLHKGNVKFCVFCCFQ